MSFYYNAATIEDIAKVKETIAAQAQWVKHLERRIETQERRIKALAQRECPQADATSAFEDVNPSLAEVLKGATVEQIVFLRSEGSRDHLASLVLKGKYDQRIILQFSVDKLSPEGENPGTAQLFLDGVIVKSWPIASL